MDKLDLSKKELNNLKKRTNLLVTIDHINSRGISDISFNPLYLPQYKRGFYGPNLQIISEDFIKEKKKVKKNKEIKIFLAQGGSNSNNLLLNLLKKINFFLKELKFCKIYVLVGQASKQKDKIFNLAKSKLLNRSEVFTHQVNEFYNQIIFPSNYFAEYFKSHIEITKPFSVISLGLPSVSTKPIKLESNKTNKRIFAGGAAPAYSNMIQAYDIASTGSCFYFGDLL